MIVKVDELAEKQLEKYIQYLRNEHANQAADDLIDSFEWFIDTVLVTFPTMGQLTERDDLFETFIPDTRLVIWYVFNSDILTIVDIWHESQDRKKFF
jgi:plasmid stabilization system protein ParE